MCAQGAVAEVERKVAWNRTRAALARDLGRDDELVVEGIKQLSPTRLREAAVEGGAALRVQHDEDTASEKN